MTIFGRGLAAHARWGVPTVRRRIAVPVILAWAAALHLSPYGSPQYQTLRFIGIAFIALSLGMAFSLVLPARAIPAAEGPGPSPAPSQFDSQCLIPLGSRHEWASAAWQLVNDLVGPDAAPDLRLVRVSDIAVELLLRGPVSPPAGFTAEAGGSVWRFSPDVARDPLPEMTPLLASRLVHLGVDEDAAYFALAGDVTAANDGASVFDEADGFEAPAPFGDSGAEARGLELIYDGEDAVVVEPFGLHLSRPQPVSCETEPPLEDLAATVTQVPLPTPILQQHELLCPRGPVEVRILREQPDLVGDLLGPVSAAAVDFVAYLALHGHRAGSGRLRDALRSGHIDSSRAGKTIWNAASGARRALGVDRVPSAGSNDVYLLSDEITCDWLRFKELCEAMEPKTQRQAHLEAALALVHGAPALGSRRFTWLDAEGVLSEITDAVLSAARELAAMTVDRDPLVASFAIAKGQMIASRDHELAAIRERLHRTRSVEIGHGLGL